MTSEQIKVNIQFEWKIQSICCVAETEILITPHTSALWDVENKCILAFSNVKDTMQVCGEFTNALVSVTQ